MMTPKRVVANVIALLFFLIAFASVTTAAGNGWVGLAALLAGMAIVFLAQRSKT